jgi:hypothetical protein
MIEVISLFIGIYFVIALLMALLVLLMNYERLKKLKWWQLMLFFILQPLLVIKQTSRGR